MIEFLHYFQPSPILFSWKGLNIHWYGLFIVLGIILGTTVATKLGRYYRVSKELILDLAFWLILSSIVGARLYYIFLKFSYYSADPIEILKIWKGGLAIHGAIIGGLIVLILFARFASGLSGNAKKNFWLLASLVAPAAVLGQAIGRWGNYFNQELFGKPTNLPWGIPIQLSNRPVEFINQKFFHPAFLYESLGDLVIFLALIGLHVWIIKKHKRNYEIVAVGYLVLYSILRFGMEFIRIDKTPIIWGLRLPQVASIIIIILALLLTIPPIKHKIT